MRRKNGKRKNPCICIIGAGVLLLMLAFTPLKILLVCAAIALIVIGVFMLICC